MRIRASAISPNRAVSEIASTRKPLSGIDRVGVRVAVGVRVRVGAAVVEVGVSVRVGEGVRVGVDVEVGVEEGVKVGVWLRMRLCVSEAAARCVEVTSERAESAPKR